MLKFTEHQEKLNNFITAGNKIIQKDNKLWMNDERVNTKTLVSLMFKLHGNKWRDELVKAVVIMDK